MMELSDFFSLVKIFNYLYAHVCLGGHFFTFTNYIVIFTKF